MAFVANVGKSLSRQDQNLTLFNTENVENGSMNPLLCMDCFITFCGRDKMEKTWKNRDRNNEEFCYGIRPTSYEEVTSSVLHLLCACGHTPLVSCLAVLCLP
jgi:hypothetical protein